MKNDLVLAHGAKVLNAQLPGHLVKVRHGHGLELGDIQGSGNVVFARLVLLALFSLELFGPVSRRRWPVRRRLNFGWFLSSWCGLGLVLCRWFGDRIR